MQQCVRLVQYLIFRDMILNRKIWIILFFLLGNSLLLFSQNYHIGDIITNADGSRGVVFWVNQNRTAGWMVALEDASTSCQWGKETTITGLPTQTSWDAFNFSQLLAELNGQANTGIIRAKAASTSGWPTPYAAGIVDYDHEWYLPSIGQLRILFGNLAIIETRLGSNGEFTTLLSNKNYWSSTQNGQSNAWAVQGVDGAFFRASKTNSYAVRAIRSFEMTGGYASYHWSPTDDVVPDIYVSPLETTEYIVTAFMGNSCSVEDQITITVNTVTHNVDTVIACDSYTWHDEQYTLSGIYTYPYYDGICPTVDTLYLTIDYTPSVTINADDDVICEGESTTIHATAEHGVPQLVSVGDILCTDGSIIPLSDWSSNNGKTAKGIVCYVDFTGGHGWAVGLNDLGTASWCSTDVLVQGLTNYTTPREAMYDLDGAYNTQTIRATGNASQFPAVFKLNNNMINEGWYLPSIGQWRILFVNLDIINASLESLGGTALTLVKNKGYWSSTQCDASKKWMLTERASIKTDTGTTTNRYVRVMCSF